MTIDVPRGPSEHLSRALRRSSSRVCAAC